MRVQSTPTETALVVGFGASGEAAARHLRERGAHVVVVEDAAGDEVRDRARAAGFEVLLRPGPVELEALLGSVDVVVPSPGVPPHHPVFALAALAGVPVRSEVELAYRWARRPMVAVTGTNGKTTVTALITDMLVASGVPAVAGGNIGLPLSDAVRRDVSVVVAEVSSFQLQFVDTFRPRVAVWLNAAEDHLDWHDSLEAYFAAKARIWENQGGDDTAVVNAEDPVVMAAVAAARSQVVTFGLSGAADYRVADGRLRGPDGDIMAVSDMARSLPHDLANAAAAAAAAVAIGGNFDGVATGLREFRGLAHRVSLVCEAGGVRWYDDSKATNPHAAAMAISGFEATDSGGGGIRSVVLIAGGRNKGLDLRQLADRAGPVRSVVAIGEAASEIERAFAGIRPVTVVASMDDAVKAAAVAAQPGDVVLLSPGCASFDAYRSYAERGDDFSRAVRELLAAQRSEADRR